MPRKGPVSRRPVKPEPKFVDAPIEWRRRLSKLVNGLMRSGKKSVAENIVYGALAVVQEKAGDEALKVFDKALTNVKPRVEVKSRRVGGANYQVPVDVRPERSQSLALRWLIDYSRSRAGKGMAAKLAEEILDAAQNKGEAVKKKEDTHKMAEANRAFAHYRW